MFEICMVLALGGLPLGHTYYLNNFESPTPKDDSYQVWLKSNRVFSRRRWKCKKLTDDTRRTKTDGNSSLELKTQVFWIWVFANVNGPTVTHIGHNTKVWSSIQWPWNVHVHVCTLNFQCKLRCTDSVKINFVSLELQKHTAGYMTNCKHMFEIEIQSICHALI